MSQRPLIIPFQTEAYVTNKKNTADKNCVRISPDYKKVEYTSYLGGKIQPAPFTFEPPLPAGIHLHFMLPGYFRRAVQNWNGKKGRYEWEYAPVPDRWIVTRQIISEEGRLCHKSFIIESNYTGLDNRGSTAIPWLTDPDVSHRFLGRTYEYCKTPEGTGEYLDTLTAMGAGDPYFAAYYPNCFSVFGFYDDMSDVAEGSNVTYFIIGFFSDKTKDPLYFAAPEKFAEITGRLGWIVEDESFFTDNCVLFSEICNIQWMGDSADYPSGRPEGEIKCALGNTSAETISAIAGREAGEESAKDWERLFNILQYEMAETLEEPDGIASAEDEIHAQTFAAGSGGKVWKLEYNDSSPEKLPADTGHLLAKLNEAQRRLNRKEEEISWWRDAVYANWYLYMLVYEGETDWPERRRKMKKEILRICGEVLPNLLQEARQQKSQADTCLSDIKRHLTDTGITVSEAEDKDYFEPREPVLMLYGDGIKRSYAFTDEGDILCQSRPITELSDGTRTLSGEDILKYAEDVPEIIPFFTELFIQSMCLNDRTVRMIGRKEGLPGLACSKQGISELACRQFRQSWETFLIEWKISFCPSRTLSGPADDSMKEWTFDGLDYDNPNPNREAYTVYTGRNMITPHSLYRFRYVAEKYLSARGELTEELRAALGRIEKLPVLSQNLDGFHQQLLSRMQTLQVPIIGNENDGDLTENVRANILPQYNAVNDVVPLFPLRAGHIRVETVNIVNTFGSTQNAFASGMNPIYSEVMGEYEDPKKKIKYGLLRPRILGGARFRFDFVTAEDDRVLAAPAPDTSPVCGIMMPELLNGRLALYSAKGFFYGSVKTVYRNGRRSVSWLSPPDRVDVGFEDIVFDNENFKSIIRYLLADAEKGGMAANDLITLIEDQLYQTLPSELVSGGELPFIWGRPLVVAQCRIGIEQKGGPVFSKLQQDYGKYDTLSAEKTEFPVMVGDQNRTDSGIVGYYENYDYTGIYPAYHSAEFASDYVRFGGRTVLCTGGDSKVLTVIAEIGNRFYFQTGILPVDVQMLDGVHTVAADNIRLCFEADSVMCIPDLPEIPVPPAGSGKTWYFEYTDKQAPEEKNKKAKVTVVSNRFHDEKNMICDGFISLEDDG